MSYEPTTATSLREQVMSRPRLVASGGPVTRAIAECRQRTIEEERAELTALAYSIRDRINADLELFKRVKAAYAAAPIVMDLA